MQAAELLILTEAYRNGILICYTNYYRANYMGTYGNICAQLRWILITVNDLDHIKSVISDRN